MNFNNENAYRSYPFVYSTAQATMDGRPWADFDAAVVSFGAASANDLTGLGLVSVANDGSVVTYTLESAGQALVLAVPLAFRGNMRFSDSSVSGSIGIWDQSVLPVGTFTLSKKLEIEPALLVNIGGLLLKRVILENEDVYGSATVVVDTTKNLNFIDGYNSAAASTPANNTLAITPGVGYGLGIPGGSGDGCTCAEEAQCAGAVFSLGGAVPDALGKIKLSPGTGVSVQASPAAHSIAVQCTAAINCGC